MKPVYRDGDFIPRLTLPLSLSYDHRVIDGVARGVLPLFERGALRYPGDPALTGAWAGG